MWELGLLEAPPLANHLLIRHCYLVDGGGGGGGIECMARLYPLPLSLQGTLIRVYDASTQVQLLELRRGAANAIIFW